MKPPLQLMNPVPLQGLGENGRMNLCVCVSIVEILKVKSKSCGVLCLFLIAAIRNYWGPGNLTEIVSFRVMVQGQGVHSLLSLCVSGGDLLPFRL